MKLDDALLRHIGNTPLVSLKSLSDSDRQPRVFAKLEYLLPTGSSKARQALSMVLDAVEKHPDLVLLDAGSGGTAEAEAMIAARLGIPFTVVVPQGTPGAKIAAIAAYGAEIVFSPSSEGSEGARHAAKELARRWPDHYYFLDQYNNPANPRSHLTTADEIYAQSEGAVSHVFVGVGTGGTVTGISDGLKRKNPNVLIHAVTPASPKHRLYGLKYLTRSNWPGILRRELVDEWLHVSDDAAFNAANYLAKTEGLLVGPSTGALVAAWKQKADQLQHGVSVIIAHDDGRKYPDLLAPAYKDKEDDLCLTLSSYALTRN